MDHPLAGATAAWQAVVDDMEATAAEYRESGWTVVEVHPGDVTPLPPVHDPSVGDGRVGLDVVVSGDEFRDLQERVESVTFDSFEAYRAEQGEIVLALLVMQATEAKLAVLVPLYYGVAKARAMLDRAAAKGRLRTFLRPLSDDERVVFEQSDPTPLFPADYEPGGDDAAADDPDRDDAAADADATAGDAAAGDDADEEGTD